MKENFGKIEKCKENLEQVSKYMKEMRGMVQKKVGGNQMEIFIKI